jgi:predicted AAA+ superfamily ATPase
MSNRERVGRAFEWLAEGLGPWVDGEMRARKGDGWVAEVAAARRNPAGPASITDPHFLLKTMWDQWNLVFDRTLGRGERTLVNELISTRNRWAHNEAFSFDDTYRALDSIERLLAAVAAPQADEVAHAKAEVLRRRYEAEAKRAAPRQEELAVGQVQGLRPWREVVTPHQDVADGSFTQAEFAAHLGRVARNDGPPEYVDPTEFFARTYLTGGLRRLLAGALARVAGTGGDPVVDLQTSFGGGKTHSMLALYHLFSGRPRTAFPQEIQELCAEVGVDELPAVRRVVIVGTELRPGQPVTKPDGTEVHTLWGELAWQLGGAEAYAEVAAVDRNATSPGDTLAVLFRHYGPCLVLIDEWVAYARQLYSRDDLPGGTLDAQVSFAQALTEQAAAVPGTLVVVSIPASVETTDGHLDSVSEAEVGGFGGKEALRRLRAVIGRMDSPWEPATKEESFEIVRRRLFEPLSDPQRFAERDAAARAFVDLYRKQAAEFPTECREPEYARRIEAAYPIHPELFARLYDDWSTLERFQRTRGVLRLMAAVVHALWRDRDPAPLVLPAGVPLDDERVSAELMKYLPETWKPILDTDVDGATSTAARLDREIPNLGRYHAARRVARTIFLGSAPHADSPHRGVETARVRLGCAVPGESIATFGDALTRLVDRSTYLYHDGGRSWYATQRSVTRVAAERAENLRTRHRDEVHAEIVRRLRAERDRGEFTAVHVCPESGADVPDDDTGVRLVVLDPAHPHDRRAEESPARLVAAEILEQRGNAPRQYRNLVLFAAADQRRVDDLERAAAEFLAWRSIDEEAEELNLDAQQRRMARDKRAQADDAVGLRIVDAYQWVLVPTQPDATGPIGWEQVRVEGQGPVARKLGRKLTAEDVLRTQYPAVLLRMALDGPLAPLWADGHVSVAALWDCFARYVYLPRLRDASVLLAAVEQGPASTVWTSEGFALAAAEEGGRYLGLVTGSRPGTRPGMTWLVVRPEVALGQRRREGPAEPGTETGAEQGPGGGPVTVGPAPAGVDGGRRAPRRFHGTRRLDPGRPIPDFTKIVAEVTDHLAVCGTVELSVEISARSDEGYPEQVVRVVTENAATLGFDPGAGFEDE